MYHVFYLNFAILKYKINVVIGVGKVYACIYIYIYIYILKKIHDASYVIHLMSTNVFPFFTEQKWKHITTWFQYLVWPNSPTLSRWPRWEWIKCGGGEGVSTIVFRSSNSSHFSPSDMTDCLTLPWACSVLPGQMTVVLHHFCKIRWEWGMNQCVFSFRYHQLVCEEVNVDRFFPVLYPKVHNNYNQSFCMTHLHQSDTLNSLTHSPKSFVLVN